MRPLSHSFGPCGEGGGEAYSGAALLERKAGGKTLLF